MRLRTFALWLCLIGTAVSAFAGDVLRYSTPTQVQVGPFGRTGLRGQWTAETDLADSMTVLIASNGGAMAPRVSAAKILHDRDGFYTVPLDAQDTADYGTLEIVVVWAGQPLRKTCRVINRLTHDEQYTPVRVRAAAADVTHWDGAAVSDTVAGRPDVTVMYWAGNNAVGFGTYPQVSMDAISGDSTAADNAELAFDGSGYTFTGSVMPTVTTTGTATNVTTVNGLAANVITAASIATAAIDADAIASSAIGAAEIGSNAFTYDKFDPGCIHTTALATGAIHTTAIADDAIDAGAIATSAIGSLEIATGAIGSPELATGCIGALELHADAVDEIVVDVATELDTHGAGNWETATGFSTHSAADVWSVATRALTDKAGFTISGTITTLDALDTALDSAHGSGSWEDAGGLTAAAVADAVWDEAIAGHTTGTTFGGKNQIGVPSATLNDYKATGFSTHSAADVYNQVVDGSGRVDVGQFLGTALDSDYPANVNVFFGVNPTTTKTVDDVGTAAGTMDANLVQIEGHALAGTSTYLADSFEHFFNQATRQYNVNTPLSSFKADVSNLDMAISALNDLDAAAVNAEVDTALSDVNLDHLVSTAAGIPAVPAGTYLDQIMDDGTAVYDRTTDSLQALRDTEPHGTAMRGTDSAYTGTPPTVVEIRQEMDSNSVDLNDILTDTGTTLPATLTTIDNYIDTEVNDILTDTAEIGAAGAGLSAIPWNGSWDAEVQSEVNDGLAALHLDHLLAVAYDPASKPGAADALLNELIESDGGVSRYTANALEQTWSVGTRELSGTYGNFDELLTRLDTEHGDGAWTTGSGTSTLTEAQVNTQVDTALSDINLDHLMKTAVANNADMTVEVTDGTVLSNIMSATSDTSTYTVADDSLEALSNTVAGTTAANLLLSTTVATVDSQTQVTLTAGSDQDDAYNGAIVILTDTSNSAYPSIRTVTDYIGTTKTLVIDAAPGFTSDMEAKDGVNIFIAERTLDQASAIDGKTLRQAIRYLGAVVAGVTSGAGTGTEMFKGLDGLTDRVQVTIANGDRTTVNYDP